MPKPSHVIVVCQPIVKSTTIVVNVGTDIDRLLSAVEEFKKLEFLPKQIDRPIIMLEPLLSQEFLLPINDESSLSSDASSSSTRSSSSVSFSSQSTSWSSLSSSLSWSSSSWSSLSLSSWSSLSSLSSLSSQILFDTTDAGTGTITAQGENGVNEGRAKAFDNDTGTKWLDFANANPTTRASWIQYQYPNDEWFVVTEYTVTSANDKPSRDPRDWVFQGSNDGVNWTDLDSRTNQTFTDRFEKQSFSIANSLAFAIYRFKILSVFDPTTANSVQLSELEFIGLP